MAFDARENLRGMLGRPRKAPGPGFLLHLFQELDAEERPEGP